MSCSATSSSGRYAVVSVTTAVLARPTPTGAVLIRCLNRGPRSRIRPMAKTLVTGGERLPRLAPRPRARGARRRAARCSPGAAPTLAPLDGLEFERATGDVTDRRAVRRAMDGRRARLPRRRADLAAARPIARPSSTPTCAAPGSSSRRRSRPGSSGSSTRRPPARSGSRSRSGTADETTPFDDRPPRARLRQLQARGRARGVPARRPRAPGGDRQPDLRARPRRPERHLDGPRAALLPRPDPRLRRRRAQHRRRPRRRRRAPARRRARARSASATSSAVATSPSTACSPTSRGSPASRRRR